MKNIIYLCIALLSFIACSSESEQEDSSVAQTKTTTIDIQSIRKIDAHAHFRYSREYMASLYKKWNMQAVLVDVYKKDFRSWDAYLAHAQSQPDLFYLCTALIGTDIDSPDYAQKAIERLSKEIDSGARMMKVWKNFGMVTKDAAGNYIQIDDERLQPIWDFLKSKNIPVMAHIAEPLQAWRQLSDSTAPHYRYYKGNPQYHAYSIPEIPSYETIITARDRWIGNNPDLNILCAHLGSMSHDVDMVAERLDKFPNIRVELAARFGDLAKQDSKKVKAFFEKYQDRVMFGSDFGNSKPQDTMTEAELTKEKDALDANYNELWMYLSSTDSMVVKRQNTLGLGLSADVLSKVYYQNIADFLKLK